MDLRCSSFRKYLLSLTAIALLIAGMGFSCSSGPSTVADQGDDGAPQTDDPSAPSVDMVDSDIIPVGASPQKGADDAWVTLVVFADFQCPFCARLAATLDEAIESFDEGTVRLVFKHFPLDGVAETSRVALAVEAASEQGEFWAMHDAVFDRFAELSQGDVEAQLLELARSLDLDEEQFQRDMNDPQIAARIHADLQLAQELQISGVPAVFANGGFIGGAQSVEVYEAAIDHLHQVLANAVEQGEIPRSDVYRASVEMLHSQARTVGDEGDEHGDATERVRDIPVAGERPETRDIEDSKVQIGVFLSFGDAPSLELHRQLLSAVETKQQVRVVYFHVLHDDKPSTRLAHRALEGADSPDEVRRLVKWLGDDDNPWQNQPELLEEFLDEHDIHAIADDDFEAVLQTDYGIANEFGVFGTPTTFINGIPLIGVPESPELEELVVEQLALADRVADVKELSGQRLYDEMVQGNRQR